MSITPHPDLAAGPPKVSADGKTITIQIKRGIHYAPPVNREVVADDVKYALERGFSGNVGNGYAGLYFGSIKGAPSEPTDGVPDIPGIETPDAHTIVLKLTKPVRGDRDRRADAAAERPGPAFLRRAFRRPQPVDVQPAPRVHRART